MKQRVALIAVVAFAPLCMGAVDPKTQPVSPAPDLRTGSYQNFCDTMQILGGPASRSAYHERGCHG